MMAHSFDEDAIHNPWQLYDELIAGVPDDVGVIDCCVGSAWTYVEAESGLGLSYSMLGGGRSTADGRFDGQSLKRVAALCKSWNWRESCLGIAALNAWYNDRKHLQALGAVFDPPRPKDSVSGMDIVSIFEGLDESDPYLKDHAHEHTNPFQTLVDECVGKKVTVIGHFPGLKRIAEVADLTILERNCRESNDVPDPACEYILPSQDFVFMTGVTMINKTAPRLLELARQAYIIMLGPSVIAAEALFAAGIDVLGGRAVLDAEKAKSSVRQGNRFGEALQMFSINKPA
jgi:uncharacterized protein (DUF4213/DUF364 family)